MPQRGATKDPKFVCTMLSDVTRAFPTVWVNDSRLLKFVLMCDFHLVVLDCAFIAPCITAALVATDIFQSLLSSVSAPAAQGILV